MTTKADERLERLDDLIERLEALGLSGPTPGATSINPDGSPGHVAAGELIESAWGNAVSDEFQRIRTPPWQAATGGNDGVATGLSTLSWPNVAGNAFSYDGPNKRFVCVAPGQYVLSAFAQTAAGTVTDVRIGVGGAAPLTYVSPMTGGAGTVTVVRTLNVGDAIQVQINNTGAATNTTAGGTRFEATRVKL